MEELWFVGGFDKVTLVSETPQGVEVEFQNVSTHPWKEREYSGIKKFLTKAEWQALVEEYEARKARTEAEARAEQEKLKRWGKFPDEVVVKGDRYLVDKNRGEVTDRWGNYLFSLPRHSVPEPSAWLKAEVEAMEYEE